MAVEATIDLVSFIVCLEKLRLTYILQNKTSWTEDTYLDLPQNYHISRKFQGLRSALSSKTLYGFISTLYIQHFWRG